MADTAATAFVAPSAALPHKLELAPAGDVTAAIREHGFAYLALADVIAQVRAALTDVSKASSPVAVDAACRVLQELVAVDAVGSEPLTLALLPALLGRLADKAESSRVAALAAAEAIIVATSEAALPGALARLYESIGPKLKWQSRAAALGLLAKLAQRHVATLAAHVVEIVPRVSECMSDVRAEVVRAAHDALTSACAAVNNRDIEKVVPLILSSIAAPSEVPETIHALSATTFVQAVQPPTLAILVPLLERGLIERSTPIKRKTAIVISNMAKLVPETRFAAPLIPKLLPGLKKLRDEVSDPECRGVATRAFETLLAAAGCETEAEAVAKAAAMARAQSTAAAAGSAPSKAAAAPKAPAAPIFKFKSANSRGKAPAAAAAAEAPAAAEAAAAPSGDPRVAAAAVQLAEALSLANLDLAGALAAAAAAAAGVAAAPAAAAGGAGGEDVPAAATPTPEVSPLEVTEVAVPAATAAPAAAAPFDAVAALAAAAAALAVAPTEALIAGVAAALIAGVVAAALMPGLVKAPGVAL